MSFHLPVFRPIGRHRRLLIEWLAICALASALVIALAGSQAARRIDNLLYDRVQGWNPPPIDDRLLIVAIDDESLRRLGRWPWPRDLHARMIRRLQAAGVTNVAYDVLFVEPSPDDAALAQAMRAGPRTFIPMLFEAPGHNGAAVDAVPPVAPIARAAAGIGHVNIAADGDGLVRHIALNEADGVARPVPHLMEFAYRALTGHASPLYARHAAGTVLIPFAGGIGAFPTASFAAILAGEVPDGFLRGRTILVGATAEGMGDRYPTPLRGGAATPGIEIQANLVNGMLSGWLVTALSPHVLAGISLVPVWLLMIGFWYWSPAAALRWSIALLVAVPVLAIGFLTLFHVWMPPAAAMAALLLVYPLWGWRRLQAASHYVDEELARFGGEPDLAIPARGARPPGDRIATQTARLALAIDRSRDVRRFASDTVQGLPDPLLVTDLGGLVTLANGAALALSPTDPIGQSAENWLSGLSPDASADIGVDLVTGDGRRFAVARAGFDDADGNRHGWLVRLVDISAIRQAEQAREDVLQLLSHDMRSPQASIITLVEQAQGDVSDPQVAARIVRYARQTLGLAENFVQLARIAATPFAPEETWLPDILAEAVDDAWVQAKQRDVRIDIDLAEDVPTLMGEPVTLRRALGNLIDNAVSFSPAGQIVTCAIRADGPVVTCRITDHGPGIAPERLARLFDRFSGDGTAQRRSTGLGLAFVKAAAERHGGSIACDSVAGNGATFTLTLSVATPDA